MKRRALLCGCNYPGRKCALKGCIIDVEKTRKLLLEFFGFEEADLTVLTDEPEDKPEAEKPTGQNIKDHLNAMVDGAEPGDVLYFHYSGHGIQRPDSKSDDLDEEDGMDEALVPTDMNVLCDDDLRDILKRAKPGIHITVVTDCCHSGGMLDHTAVVISGDKLQDPLVQQLAKDSRLVRAAKRKGLLREGKHHDRDLLEVEAELPALTVLDDEQPEDDDEEPPKNRSLDLETFAELVGERAGINISTMGEATRALGDLFGDKASNAAKKPLQHKERARVKHEKLGLKLQQMTSYFQAAFKSQGEQQQDEEGEEGEEEEEEEEEGPHGEENRPPAGTQPPGGKQLRRRRAGGRKARPVPEPEDEPAVEGGEKLLAKETGILITGCMPQEVSSDGLGRGVKGGAMTSALDLMVREHFAQDNPPPLTYRTLVRGIRAKLAQHNKKQNPCLECSEDNADQLFASAPAAPSS